MRVPGVEDGLKEKEEVSTKYHNTTLPNERLVFLFSPSLLLFRVTMTMETECLGQNKRGREGKLTKISAVFEQMFVNTTKIIQ